LFVPPFMAKCSILRWSNFLPTSATLTGSSMPQMMVNPLLCDLLEDVATNHPDAFQEEEGLQANVEGVIDECCPHLLRRWPGVVNFHAERLLCADSVKVIFHLCNSLWAATSSSFLMAVASRRSGMMTLGKIIPFIMCSYDS